MIWPQSFHVGQSEEVEPAPRCGVAQLIRRMTSLHGTSLAGQLIASLTRVGIVLIL
jgi:hypothetical protein